MPAVRPAFWTDVEILHSGSGRPTVALRGALGACAQRCGWRANLSISRSGGYACAFALIAGGASDMRIDSSHAALVTTLWVRPNDLDSQGHVNHAVALEYCETARAEWMHRNGFGQAPGVVPVVARVVAGYRRPITSRRVRVTTRLNALETPPDQAYQVSFLQVVSPVEDDPEAGHPAVEVQVQVGFIDAECRTLVSVGDYLDRTGRAHG